MTAKKKKITRAAVAQWEAGDSAPTMDKIEALAQVLGQTSEWILEGKGEMRKARMPGTDDSTNKVSSKLHHNMRVVSVVGAIQAGVWLDAIEWTPHEHYELQLPVSHQYGGIPVVGLEVRGPSMDILYPHGTVVVCAKYLDLGTRPRHGDRVVALRFRDDDDQSFEATVKEYRLDNDGVTRLWPRSTHPEHQTPIVVTPGDDALQVAYKVVGAYRDEG